MTQTPTPEEEFAPLVALAAGEVITHALPNDVRLADGRTLVLVTLDNGVERPNTFGPRGLLELRGVLAEVARRAAAGEVAAVAVTGKPAMFAAGADVTAPIPPDDAAAALLPRLGHETFSMLHSCG
ncbi:MAG TPA: 3-hydroxyacyl-CoA dehydrogenase, partial [Microbacteriaceae bacterium]|nr:3-hydroxyacyl-CoA dehydrogenase [Microbacteriaceae bacterium]